MNVKAMNSQALAREVVPPTRLPPEQTLLDMLYYMKLTRELEFRIERKLYRQGKIVGGVYVGRGQEAIAVGGCIDLRQDDGRLFDPRNVPAVDFGPVHGTNNGRHPWQRKQYAHGRLES